MKKLHIAFLAFVISLSASFFAFAGEYDVDYATFRASDEMDVVEVYFMIPRNLFKFVPVGDKFQSTILIRVALAQLDTVVAMDQWIIIDQKSDTVRVATSQKIPEISTLQVKPGVYQLITVVADTNTRAKYKQEMQINVPAYSGKHLQISDIHFGSQISKTEKSNKFSKYFGYDIIPNASSIYGMKSPSLFSFCEVYHFQQDPNSAGTYKTHYAVTDLNQKEILSSEWKSKIKPGDSAVEINRLNIASLASGLYNLNFECVDEQSGETANYTKRFYIVKEENRNLLSTAYDGEILKNLSEKELDEKFGPMKYIATETEIKMYRKSDLAGKRQIIARFWDRRDKIPQTPINEAQQEFEDRLKYANEQFRTAGQTGWKTDMGRVFIIYGLPSEVERFPSSLEKKPYQIWYYHDIEGGIIFAFVDKTGFGSMELVHSTARNELQDTNWERWITPTATGDNISY
ncbi:MAG: hypothetical protein COT43_00945 [Candidatus Marinimicrobia bacterium CG08_land_8_20_14_0_20_45_22]|nr:MAG: hypothetical protein COT43_00945 [Candidatus Marinimicrobia bacterium CG08_land_8_20_14_0_20_45_22]